jgi:beta-barrel assembly-enhancing protease
MMKKSIFLTIAVALTAAICLTGCLTTLSQIGTSVAVMTGTMSTSQADSVNKVAAAADKTMEDITPSQEYYIGRAVAATILKQYKVYDNKDATHYLNVVGQSLSAFSDKPSTFGGYHFIIMDTDEVNAFAAPGGLILVSRGLIRCCRNEDGLAAVLAHEVGHVQYAHALRAIKNSRYATLGLVIGIEAAKNLGPDQLADATKAFEGSINDIISTLVNSGYARKLEVQADAGAVQILTRVGYDPNGLKQMLEEMERRVKPGSSGFGKTHPDPKARIDEIKPLLKNVVVTAAPPARQARFNKAMAGI